MTLAAIAASACAPYLSDVGKGRCRLASVLFQKLNVSIGSILRIRLSVSLSVSDASKTATTEVLCTAWPDTARYLEDGAICIDCSSLIAGVRFNGWFEGIAEVLHYYITIFVVLIITLSH